MGNLTRTWWRFFSLPNPNSAILCPILRAMFFYVCYVSVGTVSKVRSTGYGTDMSGLEGGQSSECWDEPVSVYS